MMNMSETRKICRINDPITRIGYKIIYRASKDQYEIWTQFKDQNGKLRRNRVDYDEAVRLEHDIEGLTEYVKEYLVGKHVRFYDEQDSVSVKEERTESAMSQVSKSERLEQLFLEWSNAQENEPDSVWKLTNGGNANISKTHFRRDGIIDETIYDKERVKVLFISAEANDNDYGALTDHRPNSVNDYREYSETGHETWKGRMRERLAEMFKVISGIERNAMSNPEAALHFAIMDINKRGGGSDIKDGNHIKEYCRYYAQYIRREIEIIDPDIVAIIGTNLYQMNLHEEFLGAISENDRNYFVLSGKKVPILSLWQTSYYQGRNKPLNGYEDNRIIGKQAARCVEELKRFGLR